MNLHFYCINVEAHMHKSVAAMIAALLLAGVPLVKADYVPTEVTWMPLATAPPFTFNTILLTSYLRVGYGEQSGIAPDGLPYRMFSIVGFMDMTSFLLD